MGTLETLRLVTLSSFLALAPVIAQAQEGVKQETNACLKGGENICPSNFLLVGSKFIPLDPEIYKITDGKIVGNKGKLVGEFSSCRRLPNGNKIYIFDKSQKAPATGDYFDADNNSLEVVNGSPSCNEGKLLASN